MVKIRMKKEEENVCVCVCVCVGARVCVCVCVRERENPFLKRDTVFLDIMILDWISFYTFWIGLFSLGHWFCKPVQENQFFCTPLLVNSVCKKKIKIEIARLLGEHSVQIARWFLQSKIELLCLCPSQIARRFDRVLSHL